eukprot:COSAG05_NODE_83_length_20755_cov_5.928011_9_plen_167_part_00
MRRVAPKIVQDKAETDGIELAIGVAGSIIYDEANGQAHSKMGTVRRVKKSKPLSTLETGAAMIQSTAHVAPGRRDSLTLMQRRQEKRSNSILGSAAQPQAPSNKQDERSKISPRAARLNRSRTMGVLVESYIIEPATPIASSMPSVSALSCTILGATLLMRQTVKF